MNGPGRQLPEERLRRRLITTQYPSAPRGQRVPDPELPPDFEEPSGGSPDPDDERGGAAVADEREPGSGNAPPEEAPGEGLPPETAQRRRTEFRPSPQDRELRDTWNYIKSLTGNTIKIKVSKKNEKGLFAYLADCPEIAFNPETSTLNDIQDSVVKQFGTGEYRFTLFPPKELKVKSHSYSFLAEAKDFAAAPEKAEPGEPSVQATVPETAMPGDLFMKTVELMGKVRGDPETDAKLMEILGQMSERDRVNAETIAKLKLEHEAETHKREIDALNAKFDAQSKRIEDLMAKLENPKGPDKIERLIEAIERKETESQNKASDKMMEMFGNLLTAALAPKEHPAAQNPATDGKSELEKIMELSGMFDKMIAAKIPAPGPQQPHASDAIVSTALNTLVNFAKDGNQQPRGKSASMGEMIDMLGKLNEILKKPGIEATEALREINRTVEEEGEAAAPGKFAAILNFAKSILEPLVKTMGDGIGEGLARAVPQLAGQAASAIPEALVVTAPVTHRRVTARPIPVIPPPAPQAPAAAPKTESAPGPMGAPMAEQPTAPENPESKKEEPVVRKKQLLGTRPPPVQAPVKFPDAQFVQLRAVLDMGMPAKEVAQTIFSTIPAEARPQLKVPPDEAYAKALPYLTDDQKAYVDANIDRLKEVYAEIQTLAEAPGA